MAWAADNESRPSQVDSCSEFPLPFHTSEPECDLVRHVLRALDRAEDKPGLYLVQFQARLFDRSRRRQGLQQLKHRL